MISYDDILIGIRLRLGGCPLISSNVLPGEGDATDFPVLQLLLDMALGGLCGLCGGLWVRQHAFCASKLRGFRSHQHRPRLKTEAPSASEQAAGG